MKVTHKSKMAFISIFLSAIILSGLTPAANADTLLDAVPADSVFCVRLNNLDDTLGQMDQFLAGISPMGVSMMARMQLAGLLGDPSLQGINTTGSFGLFGVPGADGADMVVAALVPVRDYKQFVSVSRNVGEPDEGGVSTISSPGQMGGPGVEMVSIGVGSYALIGPADSKEALVKLSSSMKSDSGMGKDIDADQMKMSTGSPLWAYGDMDKVNKAYGPQIQEALVEVQAEMKKAIQSSGQMAGAEDVIKVYMDIVKQLLNEGKYASVTIKPEASTLRIKKVLAAKADTEMAKLLSADPTLPKDNKLISYLEDGSAITMAGRIHNNWTESAAKLGINVLKNMVPGNDEAKWDKIVEDSAKAQGNLMAFSIKTSSEGKPPMLFKVVQTVKDSDLHREVFDSSMELINELYTSEMVENSGMKMAFEMSKDAGKYKGVGIDSAKLTMESTDMNTPEAQMIQAMYGGGIDYRMAYVDDLYLVAVGSGADAGIKELIDASKAQGGAAAAEMKAAMQLLGGASDVDFVGTINYLRIMGMAMKMVPMPMPIPFDEIPTSSNIAFAGKAEDGKMVFDVAIPKQHISEISSGIQMLMMQQMQQGGGQPMMPVN